MYYLENYFSSAFIDKPDNSFWIYNNQEIIIKINKYCGYANNYKIIKNINIIK